jgi:O-succinylbenzoic acid--CoA ligase
MTYLDFLAAGQPDSIAMIGGSQRLTWARLRLEARAIAAVLRDVHGVRPGDIVATLLPNTLRHAVLLHAIWYSGATVAPLNLRLSAVERKSLIAHLRPVLVMDEDAAEKLAETAAATPQAAAAPAQTDDAHPAAAAAKNPKEGAADVASHEEALCSILFTSGSSGVPKAVPHSWAQHRASARASEGNLGLHAGDTWQCVIPLFHIGGLAILTRSLFAGSAVLLQEGFDPPSLLDELRGSHATLTSLVPTMLHRLLEEDAAFGAAHYPDLRAILLGGAAASASLWKEAMARGLPILGTYGLTESCSQVVTADPSRLRDEAGTAGRPLEGVDLRIRDDDGHDLPVGAEGEIWLRGPMLAKGYLRNPDADAAAFVKDWFRTGDVGMRDESGRLTVLARREDLIVCGGENILPAEVEELLLTHAAVAEAVVVGLQDEEWGQRVAAVIVPCAPVTAEELDQFCRTRLASYKLPRVWRMFDELPRTASGKVRRGKLREILEGRTT